mgnify:FL=1
MRKVLKIFGVLLILLAVAVVGLLAWLSAAEYRPSDREEAQVPANAADPADGFSGSTVRVLTFNTGYAGLSDNADFFMDGGKDVTSCDEARVRQNMADILAEIESAGADFTLLQEVDQNSARTYGINEMQEYVSGSGQNAAYALNYSCAFVPYPLPPIGRVNSGLETLTPWAVGEAERVSLPCPFSWPVRLANLKRCLLVTRTPIEGTDRELVLVNLHLEAYDDGEGKIEQTKVLLSILQEEYEKGNYVIAGGDFNQTFPGSLETYPIRDGESWTPGVLDESQLPAGWQYVYDTSEPTCRLLNQSYDPASEATQLYVIDGFIVSPNVSVQSVAVQNLQFHASDHNPVLLEAELLP